MKLTDLNYFAQLLDQKLACSKMVLSVAVDSRNVERGGLFFALPGERVDGHTFLEEVAKRGAVGAVVSLEYVGNDHGLELIRVGDVREALQSVARQVLAGRSTQVVGITGSMGKTTAKAFIKQMMEGRIFASPLSYNSQLGLPLSILMADGDEEFLLLEMGMSEPGQIERLVSIAPPDVALLTAVGMQHMDLFPEGLSAICREKAAIFSHSKTRVGIVPRDVVDFEQVMEVGSCEKRSFGEGGDYFFKEGCIWGEGESFPIELPSQHQGFVHNFLGAVGVVRALGVSWKVIQERAKQLKAPKMRFEQVVCNGIIFINDAYNASPESMKAALVHLPEPEVGKKRIAVLAEMTALGQFSEVGHREVKACALSCVDHLFCLGSRWEQGRMSWCETREELIEKLKAVVQPGDVVLLKGARVYALDEILKSFSLC